MTMRNDLYRHRNGGLYQLLGRVIDHRYNTVLIRYVKIDDIIEYVRPVDEFIEKFMYVGTIDEYITFLEDKQAELTGITPVNPE